MLVARSSAVLCRVASDTRSYSASLLNAFSTALRAPVARQSPAELRSVHARIAYPYKRFLKHIARVLGSK